MVYLAEILSLTDRYQSSTVFLRSKIVEGYPKVRVATCLEKDITPSIEGAPGVYIPRTREPSPPCSGPIRTLPYLGASLSFQERRCLREHHAFCLST